MMRAIIWKLHQWLGLLTCAGVLLWGLSGVMHPIMSRLQPRPVEFRPPHQNLTLEAAQALPTLLTSHGIGSVLDLGVSTVQGQPAYRVHRPGEPEARYFHALSGQPLEQGDRLRAGELARHYTGLHDTPLLGSRLVTEFDADYPAVNRILPVWRVEFAREDGLRAYIDTRQDRLATLSDDTRLNLSRLFRLGHNWTFLDGQPQVQVGLMSVVLLCVLFSAGSGLYFYALMRPSAARRLKGAPLKRLHRILGACVSVAALSSASSGAYHLLHTYQADGSGHLPAARAFTTEELQGPGWAAVAAEPVARFNLARIDGQAVWRVTPASSAGASAPRAQVAHLAHAPADPHANHGSMPPQARGASEVLIGSHGRKLEANDDTLARHLAANLSGLPQESIRSVDRITKFGGEYGFVFKRLPVHRVEFAASGNPRFYVEVSTGSLAARVDDGDALEGKSFSYLHKWHFTEAGKDLRDFTLATFAFGHVVVALLGMSLFIKRRRRSAPDTAGISAELVTRPMNP
jgi:hypothetical protein